MGDDKVTEVLRVIRNPPEITWDPPWTVSTGGEERKSWNIFEIPVEDFYCGLDKVIDRDKPYEVEYRCDKSPFLPLVLSRILLAKTLAAETDENQKRLIVHAMDCIPHVTLGVPRAVVAQPKTAKKITVYVKNENTRFPTENEEETITLAELFSGKVAGPKDRDLASRRLAGGQSSNFWQYVRNMIPSIRRGAPVRTGDNEKDNVKVLLSDGSTKYIKMYGLLTSLRIEALMQVIHVVRVLEKSLSASFVDLDPRHIVVHHNWTSVYRIRFEMEGLLSYGLNLGFSIPDYGISVTNNLLGRNNQLRLFDYVLDVITEGKLKVAVRLLTADKRFDASEEVQRLIIRLLYVSGKSYSDKNAAELYEHYIFRWLMNAEMIKQLEKFGNAKKMDLHAHNEELPSVTGTGMGLTEYKQFLNMEEKKVGLEIMGRNIGLGMLGKNIETVSFTGKEVEVESDRTTLEVFTKGAVSFEKVFINPDFYTAQKTPGTAWLLTLDDILRVLDRADKALAWKMFYTDESNDVAPHWKDEHDTTFQFLELMNSGAPMTDEVAKEKVKEYKMDRDIKIDDLMDEKSSKPGLDKLVDKRKPRKPVKMMKQAFQQAAATDEIVKQILHGDWMLLNDRLAKPLSKCVIKEEEVNEMSFLAGGKQGKIYLLMLDKRNRQVENADSSTHLAIYSERLSEVIERYMQHKHGPDIAVARVAIVKKAISLVSAESTFELINIIREVADIVDLTNMYANQATWKGSDGQKFVHKIKKSPLPSPLAADKLPGFPESSGMSLTSLNNATERVMSVVRDPSQINIQDVSPSKVFARLLESPPGQLGTAAYMNLANATKRVLALSAMVPKSMPIKNASGQTIQEFMDAEFAERKRKKAEKYDNDDFELVALKKYPAAPLSTMKVEPFDQDSTDIKSSETINEILNSMLCAMHYQAGLCPHFVNSFGGFTCAETHQGVRSSLSDQISKVKQLVEDPTQFALDLVLEKTLGANVLAGLLKKQPESSSTPVNPTVTTYLAMELIDGVLIDFPSVYATLYNRIYKHYPFKEDIPSYHECLTNALQQCAVALAYFQENLHGMHHDLHAGNIFIKICDKTLFNGTPLSKTEGFTTIVGGRAFTIKNLGFLCKIGDMGHSSLKIKLDKLAEKTVRKLPPEDMRNVFLEFLSPEDQYYALHMILEKAFEYLPLVSLLVIPEIQELVKEFVEWRVFSMLPSAMTTALTVNGWLGDSIGQMVGKKILFEVTGFAYGKLNTYLSAAESALKASVPVMVGAAIGGLLGVGAGAAVGFFMGWDATYLRDLVTGNAKKAVLSLVPAPSEMKAEQIEARNRSTILAFITASVMKTYAINPASKKLNDELYKFINPLKVRNSGIFHPGYDLGTLMNACAYNKHLWLTPVTNYYFQLESQLHMKQFGNLSKLQAMEVNEGNSLLAKFGMNYFYPNPNYTLTSPFELASKIVDWESVVRTTEAYIQFLEKEKNAIKPQEKPIPPTKREDTDPIDFYPIMQEHDILDSIESAVPRAAAHQSRGGGGGAPVCKVCGDPNPTETCSTCKTPYPICSTKCAKKHFLQSHRKSGKR